MTKQIALPPTLAPRLIGRDAAAAYLCVSPSTFDQLVNDGRMPRPRELTPRRWAWDVRELDSAIDGLPRKGDDPADSPPPDDFGWDDDAPQTAPERRTQRR
jgi:predicted DNA-binding transcriptional regulator AlpA